MARHDQKGHVIHWAQNGGVKTPSACDTIHWRRAVLGDTFSMYNYISCKKCRILAEINKREKAKNGTKAVLLKSK